MKRYFHSFFLAMLCLFCISFLTSYSLIYREIISTAVKEWNSPSISGINAEISESFEYDDFELSESLEITDWKRMRLIQLKDGSKQGRAEKYFSAPSGRYDVTLFYIDENSGKGFIEIKINGQSLGKVIFGASNSRKEKTLEGINILQWSEITLDFYSESGEKCRFEKILFTPVGSFEGQAE